jgi:hypothetical protein
MKAPTLRNIALTAPYMHDGSIPTLDGVIDHYAEGGRTIASGPFKGTGSSNPNKSEFINLLLKKYLGQNVPDDLEALGNKMFTVLNSLRTTLGRRIDQYFNGKEPDLMVAMQKQVAEAREKMQSMKIKVQVAEAGEKMQKMKIPEQYYADYLEFNEEALREEFGIELPAKRVKTEIPPPMSKDAFIEDDDISNDALTQAAKVKKTAKMREDAVSEPNSLAYIDKFGDGEWEEPIPGLKTDTDKEESDDEDEDEDGDEESDEEEEEEEEEGEEEEQDDGEENSIRSDDVESESMSGE